MPRKAAAVLDPEKPKCKYKCSMRNDEHEVTCRAAPFVDDENPSVSYIKQYDAEPGTDDAGVSAVVVSIQTETEVPGRQYSTAVASSATTEQYDEAPIYESVEAPTRTIAPSAVAAKSKHEVLMDDLVQADVILAEKIVLTGAAKEVLDGAKEAHKDAEAEQRVAQTRVNVLVKQLRDGWLNPAERDQLTLFESPRERCANCGVREPKQHINGEPWCTECVQSAAKPPPSLFVPEQVVAPDFVERQMLGPVSYALAQVLRSRNIGEWADVEALANGKRDTADWSGELDRIAARYNYRLLPQEPYVERIVAGASR
jgi:hypothetical protein